MTLRMSQGIHSGEFHLFLVGESHRELLLAGPAATAVVAMEKAAGAGDILLSPATAKRLPAQSLGAARESGILLASAPAVYAAPAREIGGDVANDDVADCLSTAVRAHVAGGAPPPEHRNVTVAFLRFEGTDELIAREGPERAAARLDELMAIVQRAVDEQDVCFLESDVDADGGKVMLTAGAPRIVGDDEERMLLALRRIVEAEPPLPVRIGVNGGNVFCGDLGTSYRRKYAVMGDTVNLAARLIGKAPAGTICVTRGPLERSPTRFTLTALEPFTVKGKRRPVAAWLAGPAIGSRAREKVPERFPLVGRQREMAALQDALNARARRHRPAGRDRGRTGHREDQTPRGAARPCPRPAAPARDLRGLHGVDAVRGLARAPAPAHRRGRGRAGRRGPRTAASSTWRRPTRRWSHGCR